MFKIYISFLTFFFIVFSLIILLFVIVLFFVFIFVFVFVFFFFLFQFSLLVYKLLDELGVAGYLLIYEEIDGAVVYFFDDMDVVGDHDNGFAPVNKHLDNCLVEHLIGNVRIQRSENIIQ